MDQLVIAKTARSPEIDFDFAANRFAIRGESYPENVSAFFDEPLQRQEQHLNTLHDADVEFRFELIYFNSSTAKVLMELFEALDAAAAHGNRVAVRWAYEEGDTNAQELGEEFGDELRHASFCIEEVPA